MTAARDLKAQYFEYEVAAAREALADFMLLHAERTACEVGFGWIARLDAPDSYADLCAAFEVSSTTGDSLPISSDHNQNVIYDWAHCNVAFRFVHDVHHVKLGLTFEAIDELDLARWHLDELETIGFRPDSLPWRMLYADLVGQAQLIALAHGFPENQRRFVDRCLRLGYERGLAAEAREIMARHAERVTSRSTGSALDVHERPNADR